MHRRVIRLSVVLLLTLAASVVVAGITSMTVAPSPIVVGNIAHYTANWTSESGGRDPDEFLWDYRCTEGGTIGEWMPVPADTTGEANYKWYLERRVGSYTVRCKAHYPGSSGNPPVPELISTRTLDVDVLGPDDDVIARGLGTDSTGFPIMNVTVWFSLANGTTAVGGYVEGYPQERIRLAGETEWSDWIGPVEDKFYLDGSTSTAQIVDLKWLSSAGFPNWDSLPVGSVLVDYWQENRMMITNCHGSPESFQFGASHYQHVKSGATTWKLTVVIDP